MHFRSRVIDLILPASNWPLQRYLEYIVMPDCVPIALPQTFSKGEFQNASVPFVGGADYASGA
jgi:hypothetical protein